MIQFLNRGRGNCPLSQEEYNECLDLSYRVIGNSSGEVITPIEFLNLDGTSPINLNLDIKTEYECELAFKDNTVNQWECYLGTTDVSTTMYIARSDNRDNIAKQGVTLLDPILSKIPTTEKGIAKLKFNYDKGKFILGTVGDSVLPAVFDFYYLKIYNAGDLIAHFIPVKRITSLNKKYGVQDLISSTFIEYKGGNK